MAGFNPFLIRAVIQHMVNYPAFDAGVSGKERRKYIRVGLVWHKPHEYGVCRYCRSKYLPMLAHLCQKPRHQKPRLSAIEALKRLFPTSRGTHYKIAHYHNERDMPEIKKM